MTIPKVSSRFNSISVKILTAFCGEMEKPIPTLTGMSKNPNDQNRSQKTHPFWFQNLQSRIDIKRVRYLHEERHMGQWTRTEISEINPGQLISGKGDRSTQWGKNSVFNKWFQNNQMRKKEVGPYYHTTHKNELKMDQQPKYNN